MVPISANSTVVICEADSVFKMKLCCSSIYSCPFTSVLRRIRSQVITINLSIGMCWCAYAWDFFSSFSTWMCIVCIAARGPPGTFRSQNFRHLSNFLVVLLLACHESWSILGLSLFSIHFWAFWCSSLPIGLKIFLVRFMGLIWFVSILARSFLVCFSSIVRYISGSF